MLYTYSSLKTISTQNEKVLDICCTQCEYTQYYQAVHLKMVKTVSFRLCVFFLPQLKQTIRRNQI